MTDILSLPGREFMLGEHKNIGLRRIWQLSGATMTGITATVTIYDSTDAAVAGPVSMTMTNDTTAFATATYLLTTGAGQTLTTAGTYRAVYTVSFGSEIQMWEQQIVVKSNPF